MRGNQLRLKDGRALGYIEYGRKEGFPIFLFHGTPGSRLCFLDDDETSLAKGIRLISVDRPGYGISDSKPNRTILEWVDDVEELADYLGIAKFSVMGLSGGGAYAAACGYKIPDRLYSVGMISSVMPFHNGKPPKSMMKENRIAFMLAKYAPWLVKMASKSQIKYMDKHPEKFKQQMKKGNKHLSEWDRQFLQTDEQLEATIMHLREAYRNQVDEGVNEPVLLSKPWGFELRDIQAPVIIFHGKEDRMAPYDEMLKASKQIPKCRVYEIEHAGHFLSEDEEIYESILDALKVDTHIAC